MPLLTLSLIAACNGNPSAPPRTPAAAPAPTPAPSTPAPAVVAGSLTLHCSSGEVTFALTDATVRLTDAEPYRTRRQFSPVEARYRLDAPGVHREGAFAGLRDGPYAFLMGASRDEPREVHVNGGGADGRGFIVSWQRGTELESALLTCTGTLLGATPDP
ncbi:MAG: hypothetical protein K1X88_10620 [Nannocystaceae bacterium]|nr:hypothetical protein [Nannocystaceae bacterium]